MTPEATERVKEILSEALDLAPSERSAFLSKVCADDPTVRREVESLLDQDGEDASFLDRPFFSIHNDDPSTPEPADGLVAGRRIGSYQIVRGLGEGGMGTVALAVRADDFEKQVALKVVRPDLATGEVVRRFHNERQILAHLDHPNIARILDGGTTDDGRPYFVMEYVEGRPIDEYCDRYALSVRERLELFLQVCSALRTAHQNLVVHRDLKPGNILVDDKGIPKLLDFGIAKQLAPAGAAPLTRFTHPMTLRYASPEQIKGEPITTASDVYALGVLLYELLTGHDPYYVVGGGDLELARAICDEEPRKPSAVVGEPRVLRTPGGEVRRTPLELSRMREADPDRLRRLLAGDLDSLVLKALRKDPQVRYGSVEQLSDDIRRHLEGRPVKAREGTWPYLTGKFVRRNKVRLAAVALVVAFAAAAGILWRQAAQERELKNEFIAFLSPLYLYSSSDVSGVEERRLLEDLDHVERKLDELEVEPDLQAEIFESMSLILAGRALDSEALAPLERALKIRRTLYPQGDPKLARAINNLATRHFYLKNFDQAEALYTEALEMKRGLERGDVDLAKTISNLAAIRIVRGDFDEAERLYRKGLELRIEEFGVEDPDVATSLRNLGNLAYVRGDFENAEKLLEEALSIRVGAFGPKDQKVAMVLSSLGRVLHGQKRYEEAKAVFTRCLDIRLAKLGDEHVYVASTRRDLAALALAMGDLSQAESQLDVAFTIFRKNKVDEDSSELVEAWNVQGALRTAQGRYDEAEPVLVRSYEALKEFRGAKAIYTRQARQRLRDLYLTWGKPSEATKYEDVKN